MKTSLISATANTRQRPLLAATTSVLLAPLTMLGVVTTLSSSANAAKLTDDIELSGIVRVIGGYLESDNHSIDGYSDSVSLHQQSLIALQPTWHINDRLSTTLQWVGHSGAGRESGIEWAYLSYSLNDQWQLKAGKLRMPFFHYSDSIDVGYSYPWVSPPLQLYNNKLFPTFKGANVSYNFAGESFAVRLEGLYGYYHSDSVMIAGSRLGADARVENMYGANAELRRGHWGLRLAYHTGDSQTRMEFLTPLMTALQQAGFEDASSTLKAEGLVNLYSIGADYEDFTSFYRAEWVRTVTDLDFSPTQTSYYLSAGRYIQDWTLHLTFASSANTRAEPSDELQPFLADPTTPLYPLAAGYYTAYQRTPTGGMNSVTLGARWDFRLNMALKTDISYLKETSAYSGFFVNEGDSSQDVEAQTGTLYQIGWEWIF